MYRCPSCDVELVRSQDAQGLHWSCPRCSYWLIGTAVLKQTSDPSFINSLWLQARSGTALQDLPCPACSKPMRRTAMGPEACLDCGTFWFGPEAQKALPPPRPIPVDDKDLSKLPPEAAKTIALAEVSLMAEKAGGYEPDPAWWEVLISELGLPVQTGEEGWRRIPWANLAVVPLIIGISIFSFHNARIVQDWGFVPAQWDRAFGSTLFTGFFLHAGWVHLLGNMYFLLVFGMAVEEEVGPWHFLTVLFLSHLAGSLGNYFYDPNAKWYCIGASGGIAGVMLFFAFAFPKRSVWLWGIPIPAVVFMVLWLVFQWIYGSIQVRGWEDGIGYYAHLGGGLFGWVYWFVMRKKLGLQWKPKKSVLDP